MESWKTLRAMLEKSMFGGAASNLAPKRVALVTCSKLFLIKIGPTSLVLQPTSLRGKTPRSTSNLNLSGRERL
jgi:hypothetical protein